MEYELIQGYHVYKFVCQNCHWQTQLTITEHLLEVICPRWKCGAIYQHRNDDLIFTGEFKEQGDVLKW